MGNITENPIISIKTVKKSTKLFLFFIVVLGSIFPLAESIKSFFKIVWLINSRIQIPEKKSGQRV